MNKSSAVILCFLLLFLTACSPYGAVQETTIPETTSVTVPETEPVPTTHPTEPEEEPVPTTHPTEPEEEPVSTALSTEPEIIPAIQNPVVELTEKEKTMLLKLGMAERGNEGCTNCIALVMCTVLNRVKADGFGNSVHSVIFAPEQFSPIMDGSYHSAKPNERCYEALDMVIYGWDESQGALFYEWCEGESWHSKNLHLLLQHCDVRFYD